jgi:hypothetical protein
VRLNPRILIGFCAVAIPGAANAQATPPAEPAQPEAQVQSQTKQLTPATEADIKAGVAVYEAKGNAVGKIESADAKGAVVNTGSAKAQVPLSSFGKSEKGLVISMSRTELEAAAKEKAPK